MKNMKISTQELAKICNVSQGTVDRALNGRADIKEATKERILSVAKKYGYRKNIDSQSDGIIGEIGVVVFDLNNEYFTKLISEIEKYARKSNYGIVTMLTHYDKQYEIECIRNLYNMGVEGIVLCSVNSGEEFDNYLKLFDMPIVAVGNDIGSVPYVGVDDYSAMEDMANYVINEGYENIIYFSPSLTYPDAYAQKLRYKGFSDAMGKREYSLITNIADIREEYDGKTAIIASTDYYALKCYFKAKGARIFGFDNIDFLDKYKIDVDSVGYSVEDVSENVVDIIKNNKTKGVKISHHIVKRKNS